MLFISLLTVVPAILQAQVRTAFPISFGIHADPMICWFGSDNSLVSNKGSRPGFSFGVTFNKYFSQNYSFSTGVDIVIAGGNLAGADTTLFKVSNGGSSSNVTVLPGETITYRIQYLSIPLGLKLQTNQIGYLTYFTDVGLNPKIVIGGKADIPSLGISGEKDMSEINMFNLAYHITAGIEYGVGGNTAIIIGLSFENNFLDVTKDIGTQPEDKVTHKLLSLRLGVKF